MPDALYRKTKALAALRGSTLKDLIVQAVEHEVGPAIAPAKRGKKVRSIKDLPFIRLKHTKTLDLSDFDFDDLLA